MRMPGGLNGKLIIPTSSSTQGRWNAAEQYGLNSNSSWTNLSPVLSGLVGYYTADSISGTTWFDQSGYQNHATISGSGYSVGTTTANTYGATRSFPCLSGTQNSQIVWPSSILPSTYTLFYMARYNTANSSTAATLRTSNDGSSTTGLSTPFGYPITSTGGEVRVNYNNSAGDIIWLGLYGTMDNASVSANNTYSLTLEARSTSDLANGSNYFQQSWDSATGFTEYGNPARIMSTERKSHTYTFALGSSYNLGNRWMRGNQSASSIFGANTYAYFRNIAVYQISQLWTNKIFTGFDRNWYSGFFMGNAGSAYHGQILTTNNSHSNNWVLGTDSNDNGSNGQLFRTNKVNRFNDPSPANSGTNYARLAVNRSADGPTGEESNFQIAEVIVYNRRLSQAEYQSVENYLSTKYGVA